MVEKQKKIMAKYSYFIPHAFILVLSLAYLTCTPLDDYVNKYDPNYSFKVLDYVYKGDGYTLYCINMTSQKWLSGMSSSDLF